MELVKNKVPKTLFDTSISVEFHWHSKLDLDNHGYAAKLIIDSLKGYVIKDDTKKYITQITHRFWGSKGVKLIIKENI